MSAAFTEAAEVVGRFVRRVAADPFDLDNKMASLSALDTMQTEYAKAQRIIEKQRDGSLTYSNATLKAERDRLREALETILADRCSNDFGLNPCQDIARAALAKEDG
jgi:hypothetical protein